MDHTTFQLVKLNPIKIEHSIIIVISIVAIQGESDPLYQM